MHKYSIYIKFSSIHPHNSINPFGEKSAERKMDIIYTNLKWLRLGGRTTLLNDYLNTNSV